MINRKSKGFSVFLGFLTILTVIATVTGSIYSALLTSQDLSDEITFNSGDTPLMQELKIKSQNYELRAEDILYYSSNTNAVELAEDSGGGDWSNNIPEKSDLEDRFEDKTTETFEDRNTVSNRCSTPTLDEISVSDKEYEISYSTPYMGCTSTSITAEKPIQNPITVENSDNRYIKILDYSIGLAENSREVAPDSVVNNDGSASTSCQSSISSSQRNEIDDEAESDADISSDYNSLASEAAEQVDTDTGIEISSSTILDDSTTKEDGSTSSCTYSCPTEEEPDRRCDGERYSSEYSYTLSSIDFDFSVEDETVLLTENGEESIVFDFVYEHDL